LVLFFPRSEELLVVSEREAEHLWRCLLEEKVKVQADSPILCGMNFLATETSGNSQLVRLVSSPNNLTTGSQTTPIVFHERCGMTNLATEIRENSPIMSLVSSPKNLSTVSHTALSLFNGQTSFNQAGLEALESKLILSKQAADDASFFCNSRGRGLHSMIQGSDLERCCKNILQYLHENSVEEEGGSAP
jgi:hypothetical protein